MIDIRQILGVRMEIVIRVTLIMSKRNVNYTGPGSISVVFRRGLRETVAPRINAL